MKTDVSKLPWWVPEDQLSPEAKAVLGSAWPKGAAPTQEDAQAFHERLVQLPNEAEQVSIVRLVLGREDATTNYGADSLGHYLQLLKSSGWLKKNAGLITQMIKCCEK